MGNGKRKEDAPSFPLSLPSRPLLPAHTRVTTYNANHANSPRKNSGDTNVMTEPAAPLAERRRREKRGSDHERRRGEHTRSPTRRTTG